MARSSRNGHTVQRLRRHRPRRIKKRLRYCTAILCGEVESLQHTRLSGEYRSDKIPFAKELRQRDYQECMTTNTPELAKLLAKLCTNKRASLDRVVLESRLPIIIQILAFSRHQRHCNFLPAITGVVAHSKGLPKALFDVLHAMGITESYNATIDTIAGLEALGKTTILAWACLRLSLFCPSLLPSDLLAIVIAKYNLCRRPDMCVFAACDIPPIYGRVGFTVQDEWLERELAGGSRY
jgi:hypothetical protein